MTNTFRIPSIQYIAERIMFMRIQSHLKNLRISLFGNKTGTFLKEEKDKSFVINYLSFYLVPRAGT